MIALLSLALVLLATIVGALGPIFLKRASHRLNRAAFRTVSGIIRATAGNFPLILGLFFYGISFIIYIFALSGSDLSVVYPLVSLSYVWVCLLSVKMLGERMSASKWVAVLLIISGAALVGLGS